MVADYTYDAFGNQTSETEDSNPFRYCGEYWDNESGLIYLRARYYDAGVGSFTQEDPAKDGLNWYSYCGGNPVNFWDPMGLIMITNSEEDAKKTVSLISQASGYNGYWYEKMDDGRYRIVDYNDGIINGGSRVARGMVNASIADKGEIIVSYKETGAGSEAFFYTNGEQLAASDYIYFVRETYTDRSTNIVIANNSENITLAFFHELAHALTWNMEQDNELTINAGYFDKIPGDIHDKYMEAVAITLANAVSYDMGFGIYDDYYRRAGYTIKDGVIHEDIYSEPVLYGVFPIQYTNGNARIPVKYGYGIGMFYIYNYTLGPQGR